VQRGFYSSVDGKKPQLRYESNYVNGKADGKATEWDANGNIVAVKQYSKGVIQSQLLQRWKDGTVIATESKINISPGGTDDSQYGLRKDGKEHAVYERNGMTEEHDIDWVKGTPIKGSFKESRGDTAITAYTCVTNSRNDGLVKDGVEKKWSDAGNLVLEVTWERGVATSMTTHFDDGRVQTADHPQLNSTSLTSQCPGVPY